MDSLTICRICCIIDVRMHCIINSHLQGIYEQLTALEFERSDKRRPLQVCYICYARLRNCSKLRAACLRSEELFNQILEDNGVIPTQTQNTSTLQIVQTKAITVKSCAPEDSGGSRNYVKIEHDNLDVDPLGMADGAEFKEIYIEATDDNEEDIVQSTGPGDGLVNKDVHTGDDDMLDSMSQTIKAEDNLSSDGSEVHRSVEEITESSGLEVDHSIPTIILKDIHYKTVRVALNRLELDDAEPSASFPTKLKLAKLEETTRDNNLNKFDTRTFKRNRSKEIQTIGQVVTEKAVVAPSTELGIHSSAVQYKCDMCSRCLKNKYDLLKHVRVCHVENKCNTCGKYFSQKSRLLAHIRIHTGEKPHKCETCAKSFNRKGHLLVHIRNHTGEKPYKCNTCAKSFNWKHDLLTHTRIHTGEKPYKCDTCDKSFNGKSNLLVHTRIHTSEKPYRCNTCDKSFNRKNSLLIHIRIHTGEKPYKCDICDKRFRNNGDLLKHSRIHTGVRPYKCDTCDKSFSQKGHLLGHIRIHTGERPYLCDTCDKRFKVKSHLVGHTRIHAGEKPYKCDKSFG